MNINYEKIQQSIKEYGQYILNSIRNQYSSSLTKDQLQTIDELLNMDFIVIEKPSLEDIAFFSKQEGITNHENYSSEYIPSAHGGRTKGDNKIHVYPYSKAFNNCKSDDEIINFCIENIIIHEIFHYFIRPNVMDNNDVEKEEFGHYLTEGLVQLYTEEFAKKNNLGNPKSNYNKNVSFAKKLISSFPNSLTKNQINKIIFSLDQNEMLAISQNGESLYNDYISEINFHQNITSFITKMGNSIGMNTNNDKLKSIINHYKIVNDKNEIYNELSKNIKLLFENNFELQELYNKELNEIIQNEQLSNIFNCEQSIKK